MTLGDRVVFTEDVRHRYKMDVDEGETGTVQKVWGTDGTLTVRVGDRGDVRVFPDKIEPTD